MPLPENPIHTPISPGWASSGGRVSASNWVEVSSKQTTGRWGS